MRTRSNREPGLRSIASLMSGGLEAEQPGEARDDQFALREGQVGGSDLDRERRHVLDQLDAVAIVDQAAGGGCRLEDHAVVVGQRGVVATLGDLELEEPKAERTDDQRR